MNIHTALTLATALTVGLTMAARAQDGAETRKEHHGEQHQKNQTQRDQQEQENKAFTTA
ncbi:MAG: hypothetical protein H7831_17240 [Magnetococcus sp. WYHC-3]